MDVPAVREYAVSMGRYKLRGELMKVDATPQPPYKDAAEAGRYTEANCHHGVDPLRVVTKEEGLRAIEDAEWTRDQYNYLVLKVPNKDGREVIAYLSLRPTYCDRGHIQLLMDGDISLDRMDSFPRFFFSASEAKTHVICFLKWKLWQERTHPHDL
jgi:hypothetical protein